MQLREALAEQPELNPSQLVRLVEERFGLSVHQRSIERALARQKKKTSMMGEPAPATPNGQDASEHATRYETIRRHVIEQSSFASRDGLVVLLRQGVAAWMDAWSMLPPTKRPTGTESTQP